MLSFQNFFILSVLPNTNRPQWPIKLFSRLFISILSSAFQKTWLEDREWGIESCFGSRIEWKYASRRQLALHYRIRIRLFDCNFIYCTFFALLLHLIPFLGQLQLVVEGEPNDAHLGCAAEQFMTSGTGTILERIRLLIAEFCCPKCMLHILKFSR